MGSLRRICAVAFGLLFFTGSQAVAGNWVFDESTDPSDGRKGVIIYKSPHFDTTPGAFARFIVLDDGTLQFRLRNDADGPITDSISIDFRIAVGDGLDYYLIYNPDYEAKADGCVAQWNTATACRLSCARSYEDFGLGDEVSCSTKSKNNLWIDFRAVLTAEHTEHVLENYANKIDAISFYAGSDAGWWISADDLLKHICEQTKPLDHSCRGEKLVADTSEPEQQESSKDWEYRNGSYVSIDQNVEDPEIEISGSNGRFGIFVDFIAPSHFGELEWFGLSAVHENGDLTSPYLKLLEHEMDWDEDEDSDESYIYYTNICTRPGVNKLYPVSCSSTCGDSDDRELDCTEVLSGQRVQIDISDLDETDFKALIRRLREFDRLIVSRSGNRYSYWNVGNLPDLLEKHGMPETASSESFEMNFCDSMFPNSNLVIKECTIAIDDPKSRISTTWAYFERGTAYLKIGNQEAALKDFQKAQELGHDRAAEMVIELENVGAIAPTAQSVRTNDLEYQWCAMVVNVASDDVLWVRNCANRECEKVASLPYNAKSLRLIKCDGKWCEVMSKCEDEYCEVESTEDAKHFLGWVHSGYLGVNQACQELVELYAEEWVEDMFDE